LTIGFARRAAAYKRAELILSDPDKLVQITQAAGPIQLLFAGKAHPQDQLGKDIIHRICDTAGQLQNQIKVVYLPDYEMELAALLTAGVDLWLNTPLRPQEASGTSGMKAAFNGVPSFSVQDGWWIEGHIEGVTGWSIGPPTTSATQPMAADRQDAADLYRKLRADIIPMFYKDRPRWVHVMRQTIAFNASFFNTHRMVQQYAANAYL
jgi:starch phosphorylase